MSTQSDNKVKAIPDGMHSLTPHITCAGAAEAMEFYKKSVQRDRDVSNGRSRWKTDARVRENRRFTTHAGGRFSTVGRVRSTCIERLASHDSLAGGGRRRVVRASRSCRRHSDDARGCMFWGDRYGQLKDPFGHRWALATHKVDLTPEQTRDAMMKMMATTPECK